MAERKLSEHERREIAATDLNAATTAALAEKYEVSEPLIRRIRAQGRKERREAAQEIIEKRVEAEMPNALTALGDCVETAHRKMKETDHPDYIRECRASAKTLLDYLGLAPDKDPLGDVPDEHLLEQISERLGLRR